MTNPLKLDPTRTGFIRQAFIKEIAKRFSLLKQEIDKLIVEEDAFGLVPNKSSILSYSEIARDSNTVVNLALKQLERRIEPGIHVPGLSGVTTLNTRFSFHTDEQKLQAFRQWLGTQVKKYIVKGDEDRWWDKYIADAYKKGQGRAFDEVDKKRPKDLSKSLDFYNEPREQFLRSSFGQPETKEKIKLLAARTFNELQGVTDTMSQVLTRTLMDGVAQGLGPKDIGNEINKQLGIGINRANTIARTECLLPDTLVDSAVIRAVFRRWYSGPVVEIKVRDGSVFTTTPNHPMLTQEGWVSAGLLKQGDNLIGHNGKKDTRVAGDVNINRCPTPISEIFDSISTFGIVERKIVSGPDFHGDGRENSNVDIFCTNRELSIGDFSPLNKPIMENVFTPSGLSRSSFCSTCSGLLSIDKRHCLCSSTQRNTFISQPSFNNIDIYTETRGQSGEGFACDIPIDNLIGVNVISENFTPSLTLREQQTLRATSKNPHFLQNLSNPVLIIESESIDNLSLSESTQVKLGNIVSIRTSQYSGHVYNLETPHGYFTIDNYYTGNTARAHNEATLDSLEALGVDQLNVMIEWRTTYPHLVVPKAKKSTRANQRLSQAKARGRRRAKAGKPYMVPCKICAPLNGVVLTIAQARGMFPRHPSCMCCPVPANLGESTEGQKRTPAKIRKAIDLSLRREAPEGVSLAEQRKESSWVGGDLEVTKGNYPNPLFNEYVENYPGQPRDSRGRFGSGNLSRVYAKLKNIVEKGSNTATLAPTPAKLESKPSYPTLPHHTSDRKAPVGISFSGTPTPFTHAVWDKINKVHHKSGMFHTDPEAMKEIGELIHKEVMNHPELKAYLEKKTELKDNVEKATKALYAAKSEAKRKKLEVKEEEAYETIRNFNKAHNGEQLQQKAVFNTLTQIRDFGTEKTVGHSGHTEVKELLDNAAQSYPKEWANKIADLKIHATKDVGDAGGFFDGFSSGKVVVAVAHDKDKNSLEGAFATAVHELGHAAEHTIPRLGLLERKYLESRMKPEEKPIIEGTIRGGKVEMIKDEFRRSYTGRIYNGLTGDGKPNYYPHFELVSTGMEGILGGHRWSIDDDHAKFIYGILASVSPN